MSSSYSYIDRNKVGRRIPRKNPFSETPSAPPPEDIIPENNPSPIDFDKEKRQQHKRKQETRKLSKYVFLLLLLLGGGALYYNFFKKTTEVANIVRVEWSREIIYSLKKTVNREGFDLPIGATVIDSEVRVAEIQRISNGFERRCWDNVVEKEYQEYSHTEVRSVDEYHEVFEEVDIYVPKVDKVLQEECEDVELFIEKEILQPYYFYQTKEWIRQEPLLTKGQHCSPKWPIFQETVDIQLLSKTDSNILFFRNRQGNEYAFHTTAKKFIDLCPQKSRPFEIQRNNLKILSATPN